MMTITQVKYFANSSIKCINNLSITNKSISKRKRDAKNTRTSIDGIVFGGPKVDTFRSGSSFKVGDLSDLNIDDGVKDFDFKPASMLKINYLLFNLAFVQPALADTQLASSFSKPSYYVSLGLFLLTLPGLWSLIKRSTKSKLKQRVYEVPGPISKKPEAMDDKDRAKQIINYFTKYNYKIKSAEDIIIFIGNYQSSVSQSLSIFLYTFIGLVCVALVLSIQFPVVGNYGYLLVLLSPFAGYYSYSQGDREEQVKVKMVTSGDGLTTEIVIEGDEEELERFCKELNYMEKGKIYVKGLFEN